MNLSRKQFWLLLQGIFILAIILYQSLWLFSEKTLGYVSRIDQYKHIKTASIQYRVEDKIYTTIVIVDGDVSPYELGQMLEIRYLPFAKGTAKGVGITAGDLAMAGFYIFFLVFSAALLILPNNIIGRKSRFVIRFRFPFIRYLPGHKREKNKDVLLIRRSNLYAGYVERFLFPFIMCGCTGILVYLFSKSIWIMILLILAGVLLGIWRSRKWARGLLPNDEELDAVDISLNTTEE